MVRYTGLKMGRQVMYQLFNDFVTAL
jgi:hypothetical protein